MYVCMYVLGYLYMYMCNTRMHACMHDLKKYPALGKSEGWLYMYLYSTYMYAQYRYICTYIHTYQLITRAWSGKKSHLFFYFFLSFFSFFFQSGIYSPPPPNFPFFGSFGAVRALMKGFTISTTLMHVCGVYTVHIVKKKKRRKKTQRVKHRATRFPFFFLLLFFFFLFFLIN